MPNAIGTKEIEALSFGRQLQIAGLNMLQFAYGEDGQFNYGPTVTQIQKDQIQAIYTRHNPVKARLVAYANKHQWKLATGGFTVTIAGTRRTFDTSSEGQRLISSTAVRLSLPDAPATIDWQFDINVVATVKASDFLAAAVKITDFVCATFSTLRDVFAGIEAGTILSDGDVSKRPWPEPRG